MDQLNGKDFMFACSETFLRLQYEVWHIINKDQPLTGGKLRSAEVSVVAAAQRGRWAP